MGENYDISARFSTIFRPYSCISWRSQPDCCRNVCMHQYGSVAVLTVIILSYMYIKQYGLEFLLFERYNSLELKQCFFWVNQVFTY